MVVMQASAAVVTKKMKMMMQPIIVTLECKMIMSDHLPREEMHPQQA